MSEGFFHGSTTSINLSDISLARRKSSSAQYFLGSSEDSISLIFTLNEESFYSNGVSIDGTRQVAVNSNDEFYCIMPKEFDHIIVSIKNCALSKFLSEEDQKTFLNMVQQSKHIEYNSYHKLMTSRFIYQLFLRILWDNGKSSCHYSTENYCKLILLYLFEFLCSHQRENVNCDSNYERILSRAIDFINDNHCYAVDLNQLSEKIYASKRSIQYAFSKTIDISPVQFIKFNKFNAIRQEIIAKKANKNTITKIYNQFEISNHSRFHKEYDDFFEDTIKNKLH